MTPPSLLALVAEAQAGTGLLSDHKRLVWEVAHLAGTNPPHSSGKAAHSAMSCSVVLHSWSQQQQPGVADKHKGGLLSQG